MRDERISSRIGADLRFALRVGDSQRSPVPVHCLAVDVGGSSWLLGEWSDGGVKILDQGETGPRSAGQLTGIRAAVSRWSEANQRSPISVGVSFPGVLDNSGKVAAWPNRPQWVGSQLRETLGIGADVQVQLVDDGHAAIRGEGGVGVAAGLNADFLAVAIGTGVGGGYMLAGRIYAGCHGDARTIGHIRALASNRLCACSGRGCLQTSLASLPPDKALETGNAVWPDGGRLLDVLSDSARVLGIRHVVVTGGMLRRNGLRSYLISGLRQRGLDCLVPQAPEQSSVLGALIRQNADL